MQNTTRTIITCVLLSFAATTLAQAQQSRKLSLEDAIRIGIENSKLLHSSQARIEYAEAKTSETNASRLPSLKFGGAYTRLSTVPEFSVALPFLPPGANTFVISPSIFDNYNLRLTLQQPIFTGFRLTNSVKAAEYSAAAAQEDFSKDKIEFVYNIKNAYWNLFKAMEFKRVIEENVEQVKAHLKDVQNMHQQGMVTKNELLKVQVQLSEASLRHLDAKNNVQLAMLGLNNALGLPLHTDLSLEVSVDHQPKEFGSLNTLIEKATASRSDIRGMEYRVKAGEAGVSIAKGGWLPQVYLTGNYYYSRPNQRILPTTDAFKDTWDVGIAVSFDIWNWGTTVHQTNQAEAQLAQAKDALGLMKDGVTLEVTQSFLFLEQSKERISVSKQSVEQADENFRVTTEKFKSGLALNSDVLDAEVALLQAKTNYTQSLVDYALAEARLMKSIGE